MSRTCIFAHDNGKFSVAYRHLICAFVGLVGYLDREVSPVVIPKIAKNVNAFQAIRYLR